MYYYILESSAINKKIADLEDKIRDYLSELGIAGEITAVSHARTIEYLIGQAFEKKYSTVVAVGGVKHITSIARNIVGTNVVLGVVPIGDMPEMMNFLNVSTWKEAIESLKVRRYISISLGVIDPGSLVFIVSCIVQTDKKNTGSVHFHNFEVSNVDGSITVSLTEQKNLLRFEFDSFRKNSFLSLFSRQTNNNTSKSVFLQSKGQITSLNPAPVVVDGFEITTSPITVSPHPKDIKIIVAKKNV